MREPSSAVRAKRPRVGLAFTLRDVRIWTKTTTRPDGSHEACRQISRRWGACRGLARPIMRNMPIMGQGFRGPLGAGCTQASLQGVSFRVPFSTGSAFENSGANKRRREARPEA